MLLFPEIKVTGRHLGSTVTADYYWSWHPGSDAAPVLVVVEGSRPYNVTNHQLPHNFKVNGEGVNFDKCVALHEERRAFWAEHRKNERST